MDTNLALENVRIINAGRLLDVEVSFLAVSKLGETRFHIRIEKANNLHAAVERARNELHQFAGGLAVAASKAFFEPIS